MGLQGFASFFVAFDLRIMVINERICRYGDREKSVLSSMIMNEALPMAQQYRDKLLEINEVASPSDKAKYKTMFQSALDIVVKWEEIAIKLNPDMYDYYIGDVFNHRGYFYGIKGSNVVYLGDRAWNHTPSGTRRLGIDFNGNGFWFCVKDNLSDKKYYIHDVRDNRAYTYIVQKGMPGDRAAYICDGVYSWNKGPGKLIATLFASRGFWIEEVI